MRSCFLNISYDWFVIIQKYKKKEEILIEKNWDIRMKSTHKHTKLHKHFDDHRCLSQSEESKCMWTHDKDVFTVYSYKFTLSDWEIRLSSSKRFNEASVCLCTFHPEIYSILSFPFFFFCVIRTSVFSHSTWFFILRMI